MSTPTGASASTTSASASANASATTGRVTRSRSPPASRPHSAPAPVTPCTVQTDLDWANATTASTAALFTLPVPSGSGSALEPLRDVEAMSRRLLLDRCYADGRGIGGAVHAGCKSSLAWQVLPCRSTGGGVVDGDDEQEYACDRLELRLLSSSDTSTVATSVATASAECCTLCFPADILPQPRVTVVSNGGGDGNDASAAFSISVALTNGLVYLIDVDAAALHRRTFFIRVWRVAKVLAATLGGGSSGTSSGASSVSAMSNTLSLPVLAHFASDALLLVGMSNGTLVCAELQSTQGSAQHYGEMAHHAGSLQLGYAHETVMVPEHGLLSKIIKGFIPWSTTSSSTAGVNISVSGKSSSLSLAKGATSTTSLSAHGTTAAALAARLADEDTRRYGVDLAASQPLAAEAFHVGGESYFVTWSRDQTLRVWRAGHAKCVRAESLCVGAHGSVAMNVASVGTHFRIVRRDKTGVTILLHMPHATVASSSSTTFGVYRIDLEQQVVRAIVPHALKEFRHELEINGSGVALAETLVDFVAVPQKNARSNFALWSLWRRSDGAGDTVRMADLALPQRPNIALDIARWTTVLRSAYAPRLVTFDDVVRFVSRCQSVTLLRHSYELYVGSPVLVGNIAEISKAELRDYILQAIQQQATASNHRRRGNVVDEDMNVAPNADALQLEATRFTRIAERLCVDESTAFALAAAGDGKSVLSVKPSGLGFFPVADFIDLSVAHLVGSLDVALVASDAAMRDEASVVNVLDCIAAATSGWSTDVWQPIAEDLSSRLSEPISASVITHAREMRERYFTSSTTVASLRSLSIADLELMAVVLVGEQTESRGDEAPATMSACTLFADVSTFASRRLQYALALLLAVACRATAASTQEELQRLTTLYVGAIRHVRLYRAVCTAVNIGSTSAFITAINDVLPSSNCTTARTTLHALVSVDDASLAAILAWHLTLATRYEDAFNLLTLYERRSWVLCAWGHYWLAVGDWGKAADQFELFAAEVVKYHATPAQHERPVRVLFASNTPPKLHQYYEHVMKLFTEHGATEQVLVFARHALAALITVETGEAVSTSTATARETITTSIFLAALELHRFDEAFAALTDIRTAESRLSCLKTLVSTMCDAGAERQLCRMPFHSMEGDFVASLVFKARNSNVADRPNYYHVLYAYFVGRGDYKNAAKWLYSYAIKIRRSRALAPLDAVMAQAKALLATLNVLQLLDAADQWVMVEDSMGTASDSSDELMENGGAMTGPLATLDQIKKRYHLCIAHLKLVPHVEDLESTNKDLSAEEAVSLLTNFGQFEHAAELSVLFDRDMTKLFQAMAVHCMREQGSNPRQAHDSWRRLRTFLERHDAPKHQYARTVLDTVLSYDRRFAVPSWLYALFKGHIEDLLRVLMRHGLLDKAARVVVEALQNSTEQLALGKNAVSAKDTRIPYGAVDQLIAALEGTESAQVAQLRDALARFFVKAG